MSETSSGGGASAQRWWPWCAVFAAGALFAALAQRYPAGDGDLFWQRWLGERILHEHAIPRALGAETFAAAGAPWTPHEWLFSLALAWSADRGLPWLVPLACVLAVVAALATVVLRCHRRGVTDAYAAAGVLACAPAMLQSFGVRAQVFGWAALTAVVWLLEADGPVAWLAVPATAVWANVHASAMLAPVLAAAFAAAALLRDRRVTPAVARACAIAAGCALATLATPLGTDLPRYAAMLLTSPIRQSISEWGPTGFGSAAFVAGAFPFVLALLAFGVRTSLRDRILACMFALLLFSAVRNVPVFALVAAPIALAALPARPRRTPPAFARAAALAVCAALACTGAGLATLVWRAAPPASAVLPLASAHALLRAASAPPRVFCEDFAWCSVFLAERQPARFFMDGRCDPYPPSLWKEYREVLDGKRRWSAVLAARRVDAILVRRDGVLNSLLAERPAEWRVVASDGVARAYVRPSLLRAAPLRAAHRALAAR